MGRGEDLSRRGTLLEGNPASAGDASRALLHPSLAALPMGMLVADASCSDVRANGAAAALLGVPASVNLVKPDLPPAWTVFRMNEPLPMERRPLARALRGEEVRGEELDPWRKILGPIEATVSIERTPGAGSVHSIGLMPSTVVPAPAPEEPAAGPDRAAGSRGNEPRGWWL